MNEPNDAQDWDGLQRICDARDADDERALAGWIASRPADEQLRFHQLHDEVRSAREALTTVPVPSHLELVLSRIPAAPLAWSWRDALHYRLRNWQIALCVASIAMVVAYTIWPQEPQRAPTLDDRLVQQISTSSVKGRSSVLQIASADPAKVLAALQADSLSFAAKVPHPQGNFTLLGGAIARVANSPAALTRWHGAQGDFTVYQFDAAALKLPAGFVAVRQQFEGQQVVIWPGDDSSAWALVSDGEEPFNPFCGCQ